MKTKYMAQWYESDCVDAYGFVPDALHSSIHETLDEAKGAALKGASRSGAQDVAYAYVCHDPLSNEDDYCYVNEIYNGKWVGWRLLE